MSSIPFKPRLISALVIYGMTGAVSAQTLPDAGSVVRDAESIRQRPDASPAKKPSAGSLEVKRGQETVLTAPDDARFQVKTFRFKRNTVFSSAYLQAALKDFVGNNKSLADLYKAADVITQLYRQEGYFVARAYVPAQQIKDGIVEIEVLEG